MASSAEIYRSSGNATACRSCYCLASVIACLAASTGCGGCHFTFYVLEIKHHEKLFNNEKYAKKEIRKNWSRVLKIDTITIVFRREAVNMSYILQTNHLTKIIDGKELAKDVNIHLKKGEIYGFLGPNGAGKTTVMKMITNLWKPTEGTVELFGATLENTSYDVFKRMGSIIEFPTFYEHMSGKDNLQLHCEYMGYYSKDSLTEALDMLGLSEAADKPVKRYSLGMKQRLGIARAILCKPELVVLDEPTNGLDPAGMKQIRDLFQMLSTEYGITFLISSHLLSEIESIANTIGIISRGKLIREISMREISEMNTAFIELSVENTQKAAYILSDKMKLNNFKIMNDSKIRIYEISVTTQKISKELLLNGVEIISITRHTESLEDYFLKITGEAEKSC